MDSFGDGSKTPSEEADKNRRVHCAAAASAAADIDAAPAAAQMDDDIDPALLPAPEERPEAKAAVVKSRLRQQYEEYINEGADVAVQKGTIDQVF